VPESTEKVEKLNTAPMDGLTFTDPHPVNGKNYTYYATSRRAQRTNKYSNPASHHSPT